MVTNTDAPEHGNFSIRRPLVRVVDAAALVANLEGYTLIDARSKARFDAIEEPFDEVAGHIPGAHCVPFTENLDANGRFLSPAKLRARFERFEKNPVCYCGSGVTAAHNVLAMLIAGLPEPALYPGSWSEWIRDPDRPRVP
jgi:thiosulfate/3-mercaptopyruvate sulfurtransferase